MFENIGNLKHSFVAEDILHGPDATNTYLNTVMSQLKKITTIDSA